ncbi:hypothetical protein Tco_1183311 [Tanacetum coccineum]
MITEVGGTADQVQDGFSHEIPPVETPTTTEVVQKLGLENEVAAMRPPVNKRRRKRGNDQAEANALPKVLRKDHAAFRPAHSTLEGKSLASMELEAGSTFFTPAMQETSSDAKSVSDPESLSYVKPQPHPEQDVVQSSRKTTPEIPTGNVATAEVQDLLSTESLGSGKSTSVPSLDGSPGSIYHPGWGVTNNYRLDTPDACQNMVDHIVPPGTVEAEVHVLHNRTKNLETLLVAEVNMKKATEAKNVSNLQAQVMGEEKIKAAFEVFKKYEDNRVEQRCVEMDARLDKLSVDFDEELYPHLLTAIAGRRWVIGHDLCLAVMKCTESPELRQAFANIVSAGLVKGMSEGLEHGIEHGKVGRDLAVVEAYNPEANNKYVKALQDLKDLKYPLVDQLEKLKDAPMELTMASLHLESDSGEDAPQIDSAHHARSDGIPVSAPTIAPQGLAILLANAATQTEVADKEEEPHPRL